MLLQWCTVSFTNALSHPHVYGPKLREISLSGDQLKVGEGGAAEVTIRGEHDFATEPYLY